MNPSPAGSDRVPPAGLRYALAIFAATLSVYLITSPRTVVLEDDGFFLQAAWSIAPAHPPGYPLYVALAHAATLVPAGTVAFRVHALTGVFAALACAALFVFARRLGLGRPAAVSAALALGVSEAFWSQAIIAEVYSLNVLLILMAACLCLLRPDGLSARSASMPAALGFVYGLALSNHWPLVVLSSPMLLLLAWPARENLWRARAALLAGLAAGLIPYAWMIWRTHVVPESSFAGPIASWRDFWFYVGREAYARSDHSISAGWWDRAQFAGFITLETLRQFGWLGALLGVAGLFHQWRLWPRHVCWGLVAGFLGSTLLLILLLGFDYDAFHRYTFRVYPLVSYAVFALWIGLGIQWAAGLGALAGRISFHPAAALGVLLVGATGILHWPANDRSRDVWAEVYARAILDNLPAGTRLFANADTVSGPVGYLHHVEGVRPDVMLASGHSLSLDGRVYRPHALRPAEFESLVDKFIATAPGPIAYSNDFPHRYGADFYGLYLMVNRDVPASAQRVVLAPPLAPYFRALDRTPPPRDPWESMHYRLLRLDQCRLEWSIRSPARYGENLPSSCLGLHGRLWLAERQLSNQAPGEGDLQFAAEMLNAARTLRPEAVYRDDLMRLETLTARVSAALRHGE